MPRIGSRSTHDRSALPVAFDRRTLCVLNEVSVRLPRFAGRSAACPVERS